jgi:hypothetical protein
MIKTHNITGLKYLCQTRKKNPHKYLGSGKDWCTHLEKYGKNIKTEIILTTSNKEELNKIGRYYSNLWRITSAMDNFGNKIWANIIPETGGGPGCSPESNKKMFANGKHPFQDKNLAKRRAKQQVENGTHNFIGGKIQKESNMRRIKNGTHHFLSGESSSKYQKKMVNSKLHPFQNTEWQKTQQSKLVEKGTHHFLGEFSPTQVKWTCEKCGKSGKGKSNFSRWHSH